MKSERPGEQEAYVAYLMLSWNCQDFLTILTKGGQTQLYNNNKSSKTFQKVILQPLFMGLWIRSIWL